MTTTATVTSAPKLPTGKCVSEYSKNSITYMGADSECDIPKYRDLHWKCRDCPFPKGCKSRTYDK